MVWGGLIKAGVAIGASALASDKVANAVANAVEKSSSAVGRAADALGSASGTDPNGDERTTHTFAQKRSVTAKCIGCHAPMSGDVDVRYRCPYCDTVQTLD